MKFLGLIFFSFFITASYAGEKPLNQAVADQDWKKVSKLISNKINGTNLPKGKYNAVFDSLISHFKSYECVVDAEWSKCGAKLAIYPGREFIAIQFKTGDKTVEKIFDLATAKYQTHKRFLGIRFRIPTIERNQMVYNSMRDSDVESIIDVMREVCVWEVEEALRQKHNSKLFFTGRIIGGIDEGSFPPLNFNCETNQVKIEFSATNKTEDTIKLYWPLSLPNSDPLFRVNFQTGSPIQLLNEDTAAYIKGYDIITLLPNETIKSIHFLFKSHSIDLSAESASNHLYKREELDSFQVNTVDNGFVNIGFSAVNNGLTWQEDMIWKPAQPLYVFQMAHFTITDICD